MYSFEQRNQFSFGNNVLDAALSNIRDFLWRDTSVSSTQLNRPIWSKQTYLHHEKRKLQEEILAKLTQFSQ
jgi:hypothetical protein